MITWGKSRHSSIETRWIDEGVNKRLRHSCLLFQTVEANRSHLCKLIARMIWQTRVQSMVSTGINMRETISLQQIDQLFVILRLIIMSLSMIPCLITWWDSKWSNILDSFGIQNGFTCMFTYILIMASKADKEADMVVFGWDNTLWTERQTRVIHQMCQSLQDQVATLIPNATVPQFLLQEETLANPMFADRFHSCIIWRWFVSSLIYHHSHRNEFSSVRFESESIVMAIENNPESCCDNNPWQPRDKQTFRSQSQHCEDRIW